MIFDTMTIACCAIVLILAIISIHCNALFRKLHEAERQEESKMPKLSVIITAHDAARDLEDNLSGILSQVYSPGYEVIVVNAASTDDTEGVLKRFNSLNSNLYTTFTPDSSRYMSRKKLAVTLGVKAAKNEWIVLIEPYCRPDSDHWLETIGRYCTEHYNLVLGYSNFEKDKNVFRKSIYTKNMFRQYQIMREASKGTAYCAGTNNIAFRRSDFMSHNGFASNLRYLRGEYDFIVNDLAETGRTAVITEPDVKLTERISSLKKWRNNHLYYMETRKHLQRSFRHRLTYDIDTILQTTNYLVDICFIVTSILYARWIITIAACFALLLTITLRTYYGMRVAKNFNEHASVFSIVPIEISSIISNLGYMVKYMMADKMNFIRK
jgi:glycosyltransferase involved in cell wall biosynthesis